MKLTKTIFLYLNEKEFEMLTKDEMYARDISRKVRSAHRIRGNMGEPLSQPPYGYMKSPENKKKWIIDTEAAEVVRDIYRMCIEGMNGLLICPTSMRLNEQS